jgi:hypothetical protein
MTNAELDAQLDMFTQDPGYQMEINMGQTARWEVNHQRGLIWSDYDRRRGYRERAVLDPFDTRGELDRETMREEARENTIHSMAGVQHFTPDVEEIRRPVPSGENPDVHPYCSRRE